MYVVIKLQERYKFFCLTFSAEFHLFVFGTVHEHLQRGAQWKSKQILKISGPLLSTFGTPKHSSPSFIANKHVENMCMCYVITSKLIGLGSGALRPFNILRGAEVSFNSP